jgi:pimeloyl-ACP methyl ester carboxylesterase
MTQRAAPNDRGELLTVTERRAARDVGAPARRGPPATTIVRMPAPGAEDISLGILAKQCRRPDPRLPPVLLVHGATIGATLFDLPLPSYSLMSNLASAGRSVYAVDIRGFGHSLNGTVMASPPHAHAPFPLLDEAVSDIAAAVEAICEREQAAAVDLLGFSWGTVTSSRYAGAHPERVARLVLYAPLYAETNALWLGRIADREDRDRLVRGIDAYRLMTRVDLIARWDSDLPTDDPALYREGGVPEILFEALSALDPGTQSNGMPAFRCPAGALVDLLNVFNGRPLFDPSRLTMPTLLVRGGDDTTSTDTDARRLLAAIAATEVRYQVITPGSHFLLLERNRAQLYQQLNAFLGPLEHDPEKACPGPDPGWVPVFGKDHAPPNT